MVIGNPEPHSSVPSLESTDQPENLGRTSLLSLLPKPISATEGWSTSFSLPSGCEKSDADETEEQNNNDTSRRPSTVTLNALSSSSVNRDTTLSEQTSSGQIKTLSSLSGTTIPPQQGSKDSRRPSAATLKGSSTSIDQIYRVQSSLSTLGLRKSLCLPGYLSKARAIQMQQQLKLCREMRLAGFEVDYAPFEPEYIPTKYYRSKKRPFQAHVTFLVFFILWTLGVGGYLSYRTWGMYVGYSTKWHWTSVHQDLRFDDKMWKLYVSSLIFLDFFFLGVTYACLWLIGEAWWRDLVCLGLFRVIELVRMMASRVVYQQMGDSEKIQEKTMRNNMNWDYNWEEEMMYRYRAGIWRAVVIMFVVPPLALIPAFIIVLLQQDKCYAHSKGIGFGY